MSRRRPKTLADEAERYAERVCKKIEGETVQGFEVKLMLVLAFMAGAHAISSLPQKELA